MTIKAIAISLMFSMMLQATYADQTTPHPAIDFDASAEQAKQKADEAEEAKKATIKHAACMIEAMKGEPETMQAYAETLCTFADTDH
jgi:hypothetical protein